MRDGGTEEEKGDCAIDIVLKLGYDLSNFSGHQVHIERGAVRLNIRALVVSSTR